MKPRCVLALTLFLLGAAAMAGAGDQNPAPQQPHISRQTRMDLIRSFNAELVYIRAPFPMGSKGLVLKDGKLSPSGADLDRLIAMWGPAVKAGDQARISQILIKPDRIHFEINGGPVKKSKWYQHISVGMNGAESKVAPNDPNANPRGSFVDLVFEHYVPDVNPQQLKDLLRPVFDFDAKSAVEAYLETVPPKVKVAVKNHEVLVGMNREMVIYAKGRPEKKVREKDGETEYEEWIYGEPPHDVDFVRLVGDEVVRVETMKVNGEKLVRTEKEIELNQQPAVAADAGETAPRPANAPSLRRPGEEMPEASPSGPSKPKVAPPPNADPGGGPGPSGPNWRPVSPP